MLSTQEVAKILGVSGEQVREAAELIRDEQYTQFGVSGNRTYYYKSHEIDALKARIIDRSRRRLPVND